MQGFDPKPVISPKLPTSPPPHARFAPGAYTSLTSLHEEVACDRRHNHRDDTGGRTCAGSEEPPPHLRTRTRSPQPQHPGVRPGRPGDCPAGGQDSDRRLPAPSCRPKARSRNCTSHQSYCWTCPSSWSKTKRTARSRISAGWREHSIGTPCINLHRSSSPTTSTKGPEVATSCQQVYELNAPSQARILSLP